MIAYCGRPSASLRRSLLSQAPSARLAVKQAGSESAMLLLTQAPAARTLKLYLRP